MTAAFLAIFAMILNLYPVAGQDRVGGNGGTPPKPVQTPIATVPPRPTIPAPTPEQSTTPADTAPVARLTADEAVAIALRTAPAVEIARQTILAAGGRVRSARAGLQPTLSFTAGLSVSRALDGGTVDQNGFIVTTGGNNGGATGLTTATTATTGTLTTGTNGTNTTTAGTTGITTATNGGSAGTTATAGGTTATTGGTATNGGTSGVVTTGGGSGANRDPIFGFLGGTTILRTAISVNQLVFDFNRTRNQVRQQEALRRASRRGLSATEQDTALLIRNRYYNLLQSSRLVEVAEANLRNTTDQSNLAQAQLDAGLGPPSDVVRARTQLASAIANLVTARNDEDVARVLLAEAMGIDPRTPLQPVEGEEALPAVPAGAAADVPTYVDLAIARRAELAQAREQLSASEFALDVAKKTNFPQIVASLGLQTRGNTAYVLDNPTATGALSLSWNFADGGLTRGRTETAEADRRTALETVRLNRQTIVSEVAQAYVTAANTDARLVAAEAAVANATEGVRLAQGRYSGGFGTFLEVITAQNDLFTAQRTLEIARYDVARARAAFRRAVGEELPNAPPPPRE